MNKPFLTRRRFNALCAAAGLSLASAGGLGVLSGASALAADSPPRKVKLRNGAVVPAIGQGTWHLGQGRHPAAVEEEALRTGVSLGLTLIDTSGNYGNGRSEELIGRAIAGQRDRVFLVSKIEAYEAQGEGMARACEASLRRLGTDHLDLYLLHAPVPASQFSEVVAGFERLRAAGKIRAWGVSNFNTSQMDALFRVPNGDRCATNQVPYSLNRRAIERDLLPWSERHGLPVMAYSPLGGDARHPQPDAGKDRRRARRLGRRGRARLGRPGRRRHRNSRIRSSRACQGERCCAFPDAHAARC